MHGPLKGVLTKDHDSAAMVRERDDWGYYVRAIRDLTHPPSWRWRIIRRGNPMGVLLEAGGFSTYEAARFAGNRLRHRDASFDLVSTGFLASMKKAPDGAF